MSNPVEDIVAEKVAQEIITVEEIKEVLEAISTYTALLDVIVQNFEQRIGALEL